uniref:Putative ATP-dependent RNA helicase L377 n=1 Tax=Zeugodacus cucurbitae TaxID=28588 RepID=A0A0A1XGH8_ZEUCU
MSKVIEISDSEEESEKLEGVNEVNSVPISSTRSVLSSAAATHITECKVLPPEDVPSTSKSPPPLKISSVSSLNTTEHPVVAAVQNSPTTNNDASSTVAAGTSNAALQQQSKRSRRKSMHHPLCASPEIEFETISLDDDEEKRSSKVKNKTNSNNDGVQQNKSPKLQKIAPKILNNKPQTSKSVKDSTDACAEFLASDETKALLQQIAEDRVRINFLLASYNMPEIQFSLHTKPDVLQFQLEERIKHRKRRSLESSKQMKKRRSLLQNTNTRSEN